MKELHFHLQPYQTWINISDVPEEIKSESIDLIDESFNCRYYYSDDFKAFKKRRFTRSYLINNESKRI